jgi:Lrp/AsnC family transcriptional regulator for asnA, asnC and gidA
VESKEKRSFYSDLDDLDYGIVNYLQENARTPFTHIAEALGVTERTIRTRVAQLQEEGALRLVGVVNPVKAGIRLQTLVQVATDSEMLDAVIHELNAIFEVRLVILTAGEYQLMLEVFTRDQEELSRFLLNKLNKIKGITRTNVIMELKIIKSRFKFVR